MKAPKPPRMTSKVRVAVEELIWKGKSVKDAAAEAGMNADALSRAINRPAIREYIEEQKSLLVLDVDKLKAHAKPVAILVGIDLLHNAKSEAVKARMVELFTADPKPGTQVNVQINNDRGGYEYARPGQQVVEIRGADDQSPAQDSQATDDQ